MNWLPILALAALVFVVAAFVLRLPRTTYALFGAALLFGLAGYALQGSPGMASVPKPAKPAVSQTGELIVAARREFFDPNIPPSRFVVTADGFTRRGRFETAANMLRNAVREAPGDLEAWLALGNVLVEHAGGNLTAAALYAYSRAERLAPEHPGARYFYGLALARSGQLGQARVVWAELLEDAPGGAQWRAPLAERLARLDALLNIPSPAPDAGKSKTGQ